jgi:transcription-repair coupling factor (superfamily II helicase)
MSGLLPLAASNQPAERPESSVGQLLQLYAAHPLHQRLRESIKPERSRVMLSGLSGSLPAVLAAACWQQDHGHLLLVFNEREEAAYFYNDLSNLLPDKDILFFPASYRKYYDPEGLESGNVLQRAEVLNQLNHAKSRGELIVTYPEALAEKVVNKFTITKNTIDIRVKDVLKLDFLTEMLVEYGFEREDFVYEPGQFSIRGGIIDVFSFAHDLPYRIELFGDEVESIRTFDPESQLSVKTIHHLSLIPNVQTHLLKESRQSMLDFVPADIVVWVRDVQLVADRINNSYEKAVEHWKAADGLEELTPGEAFETGDSFRAQLLDKRLVSWGTDALSGKVEHIAWEAAPQPSVRKNFDMLIAGMQANEKQGYRNLLFSETPKQIERLYHIFEDLKAGLLFFPIYTSLHEGFIDRQLQLSVYTDHQIFERYHKYRLREYKGKGSAITLKEIRDLRPGDHVVHIDHGVGVFEGMEKLDVNGQQQEAVRISYRDGDLLYVGINSLHKIAKYSGKEGIPPRINKLGSDVWEKLKSKTKSQVKDIAKDLIALYAKRKAMAGFAFTPDSYLQNELEASFMYEDTPDQYKATEATKADMQKSYPMDRLVCGDVGFGKTEIAIRAAFKAATDGKQVAVLVPTTILALQHYKTFSKRLAEFPVTVDYLNRFRSAKEQKDVLERLEQGKIDILIGTHKIVGKQVKFKDIGLLVIDEEQKFGVGVKEKLRQLRVNVDTLTLTATPIPRTLQFSLMGARDLSVISTPPPNRQPVHTELMVLDEEKIQDAINFEVDRGGQVFFVHNRVGNIQDVATMIRKLCPRVSICVGHGQMEGDELEDILLDFIDGRYDVLVATNIIESGLDIPNANTIIINQAQNFGLSDLHQMRGRVGRSNIKAFCYLVTPPLSILTNEARKRLKALEEYSDLGSGFQIAMRDLDIRGAGNMLGAEQSGFITEIGFDMYQKILDEAIRELKDSQFSGLFDADEQPDFVRDVQLDTDLAALLPDSYVRSTSERLSLYMQLDNTETPEGLERFRTELVDRFGPIPYEAETLFTLIQLRWEAKRLGMEKVMLKKGQMKCYFVAGNNERFYQSETFGRILEYVQQHPKRAVLKQVKATVMIEFTDIRSAEAARVRLQEL